MDSPSVPAVPDTIHVLLVDDEQLSRFVVGNLLRKCNYAVTVVDSGAQALDLLSRSAPGTFQLILTDLMMPEVDGLDILRYVRSNTLLEDLPVIMMSANEQKDTVFQAIKGGAEEYLVKPVTKKEVQNIWQHVWKRLKATQLAAEAITTQQQQQQQAPTQANGVQPGPQQQQQQSAASAAVAAATAAAGAAAALHRGGSSRGMRHLQQQQKLFQQQHTHNQLQQQRQQQGQPQQQQPQQQQPLTAQQQELFASMQQLHQAQQPAVFRPDRRPSSDMHSQILLGQLLPKQQQQQAVSLQQLAVSLQQQQQQQQQQQANQEDFESLTFFLNTLHGQRAAEAAAVRATVADLDTRIAEVQAALQQLQPQQQEQGGGGQPGLCAPGTAGGLLLPGTVVVGPDRPGSAGIMGESLPPAQAAAAATAAAAAGDAAAAAAADGNRQLHEQGSGSEEEDEDDLEMERRERSRRHKRQRVMAPAQQQQQLGGGTAADAGALLQLQLARQGSTTGGTSGGLQLQPAAVGSAGAAAGECGSGGGRADPVAAATAAAAVAGAAAAGVSAEILSKWQHVSGKFDTLQAVYLRQKQAWSASQQQQQQGPEPGAQQPPPAAAAASKAADSAAAVVGSSGSSGSSGSGWAQQPLPGYLSSFGDDLWGYSRYSRLAVRGTVRAAADLLGGGSAMVCAAACDRDDEYVATAGVSKRIRIFEYDAITSAACGGGGCLAGGGGRPVCTAFGGSSSSLSGSDGGSGGAGGACWGGAAGGAAAAQADARVVYPVLELSSRSRLSCVAWSPYVKAQLASSDYEGVVQLWDANTGSELMQLEEHSKRAWAVDFSRLEPTRLVSSSDDGTVKLWSIHQEASVGTLNLHANVCSVQFSPDSPHLLAAGCANYRFYLYDLRNTAQPLVCVPGHRRSVSYVRWLDGQQLVTASTDNTLRRWAVPDLLAAASSGGAGASREIGGAAAAAACRMTYGGHTNNRNFIGLAVLPGAPGAPPAAGASGAGGAPAAGGASCGDGCGGYIVCGSETNEAYVYHSSVPLPVASHSFQSLSVPWGQRQQQKGKKGSSSDLGALAELADAGGAGGKGDMFVSCVAWNRRHGTLVAANSAGHIQVLELA